MKLYANNQVYLQGYDLTYMITVRKELPSFILAELKEQLDQAKTRENLSNQFNFAFKFQTIQSVKWLMECEYILDYLDYRNCSTDELDAIIEISLETWYNMMFDEGYPESINDYALAEDLGEMSDFLRDFCNLSQNIYSLSLLQKYKSGEIDFPNLPEEYRERNHIHDNMAYMNGLPIGRLHRRLEGVKLRKF